MLNSFSIVFGLFSAISFGFGDFAGGFLTKKNNVLMVLLYSQITGSIFLFVGIMLIGEKFTSSIIFFSALSGIFGGLGLLAFYRGLSLGNMGVVAPITGVITPIIPILVGIFSLQYSCNQILGIILALLAIWLVSTTKIKQKISYNDVLLAIIAGIGFGFFLLFIDMASTPSLVLFPILIARFASITMILLVSIYFKKIYFIKPKTFGLTTIPGILDTIGNLFFIYSSKTGRIDFASVLLSLGPVVTVLLAWKILHEKLTKIQILGIALSVVAIIFLSS